MTHFGVFDAPKVVAIKKSAGKLGLKLRVTKNIQGTRVRVQGKKKSKAFGVVRFMSHGFSARRFSQPNRLSAVGFFKTPANALKLAAGVSAPQLRMAAKLAKSKKKRATATRAAKRRKAKASGTGSIRVKATTRKVKGKRVRVKSFTRKRRS